MLPFSIMTFMSLTQAPCTPRKVLLARATASFMAASKLSEEMALNSVTVATVMSRIPPYVRWCNSPTHEYPAAAELNHPHSDRLQKGPAGLRSCPLHPPAEPRPPERVSWGRAEDRKSTRLNSSHANISYAVFCLKKKKKRSTIHLYMKHCR